MNLTDITLSKGLLSFLCNLIKHSQKWINLWDGNQNVVAGGEGDWEDMGELSRTAKCSISCLGWCFQGWRQLSELIQLNAYDHCPSLWAYYFSIKKKQQQKTIGQLESPSLGWQMRSSYTATSASAPMTDIIHGFQHSAPLILSGASAYTTT